ncbi:hypothetical protein B1806_11330 [Metallibacterium scheffleri]|uniref:Uncharacterized protein n=2 Tax=Metallibacterium scheffleri TaxID=993689 RepID=A0A4S3KKN2_9GAMM|nr:hypothetical protein B1806_11330 [Metallibacterium scheffleri]
MQITITAAALAARRAADAARGRRYRAAAAANLAGVALDREHVAALKSVQRALRAPSRAAAIRASIMLAAELIAMQSKRGAQP